jgi:hypothetical protein
MIKLYNASLKVHQDQFETNEMQGALLVKVIKHEMFSSVRSGRFVWYYYFVV